MNDDVDYLCKLQLPAAGVTVEVRAKLAPIFLRFTFWPLMGLETTWAVLAQPSARAHDGEEVIVAERVALDDPQGLLRLPKDRSTRIVGGCITATYRPVDPQPDRAIGRNADKWISWQLQRLGAANFPTPPPGARDANVEN